jgi:hypothetical protein
LNTPSHEARLLLRSLVRGNNEVPNVYVRNVQEGLYVGLRLLKEDGVWRDTRSGRVIEYPAPVMTIYKRPEERVLFYPIRDANPFFHLFEALWMLAGQNDLEFVSRFNNRMKEFSDDGVNLHGAYGYRWRKYFSKDQLNLVVSHLKQNPDSRRAVLQMWSADDLQKIVDEPTCKDVPCNTQVYFKIRGGRLQMTVTCRSNDIIWGTYGANAVHFSILQEYIAARIGTAMGTYYHLSDSYHAYEKIFHKTCEILKHKDTGNTLWYDSYLGWNKGMHYSPEPLFSVPEKIDEDLWGFMRSPFNAIYKNPFFKQTAVPMLKAWGAYKQHQYEEAIDYLQDVPALDWRKAAIEWLERRQQKYQVK